MQLIKSEYLAISVLHKILENCRQEVINQFQSKVLETLDSCM